MKIMFGLLCFLLISNARILAQDIPVLTNKSVAIKRLDQLNTKFRECNLSIMPNGKELYFMSTRRKPFNNNSGDGDIYKSIFLDREWMTPQYIEQINTNNGEDEPSVSHDGEKIFFQSWSGSWQSSGGPYYEAEISDGELTNIKGLGGGINQFFRREFRAHYNCATDGMAVSPDGKLFIVACGTNYEGNMDLYYSVKQDGEWSFLKRLNVSTEGDERSVYIASDNKTIYFSSNGHGGFGGLDILKTTWFEGNASEVINVGEPFNTNKNDLGFVISGMGDAAFFIRDLDIYFANLKESNELLKPDKSFLIYGNVFFNDVPLKTRVVFYSNGVEVGSTLTDSIGKYTYSSSMLYDNLTSKIFGNQSFESQMIHFKNERYQEYQNDFYAFEAEEKLFSDTVSLNDTLTLPKELLVYFDFDDSQLSQVEIKKLLLFSERLDKDSELIITGHTDLIGSACYNSSLSKIRAKGVREWLIRHSKVKMERMNLIVKGENEPLNQSLSSQERALNRRVSIQILIP
ncbi:MAG: OmpA family protein [Crocinitomicaceae bacterium]|nr:OmpA family protein [Crocinitomicaceae bacterium]